MKVANQPFNTFTLTNAEGASVDAGVAVGPDGAIFVASADGAQLAGVNKFETDDGKAMTVQTGMVPVLLGGPVSAGDRLTIGDGTGIFTAAAADEPWYAVAQEAGVDTDLIEAFVMPLVSGTMAPAP